MGWFSDDAIGHEGWAVGLVSTDPPGELGLGRFRELARPADRIAHELHHAQAGCECGWRSERISVSEPMTWDDGWLQCSPRVDDRLARLWAEHIAHVAYRIGRAQGLDGALAIKRLRSALESVDRCKCGHERRLHGLPDIDGRHCSGWDDFVMKDGRRVAPIVRCPCREFHFMPTPA